MEKYLEILSRPDRPKIGVIVGSGGLKSSASIELFDFLEKANIPIDVLAGCSGGSIATSLKATGRTSEEIREATLRLATPKTFKVNYRTLASIVNIPFFPFRKGEGLFRNDYLLNVLGELYGQETQIENLKIPLYIQATDVDTGLPSIRSKGHLATAVYASAALIPFFPPIEINGQWLADGGYSSSIPILPVLSHRADVIIVFDPQAKSTYKSGYENTDNGVLDYFKNFLMMTFASSTAVQNSLAVTMHHHEIIFIEVPFDQDVEMWEGDKLPYIYGQGKAATEKAKDQIISAIETFVRTK